MFSKKKKKFSNFVYNKFLGILLKKGKKAKVKKILDLLAGKQVEKVSDPDEEDRQIRDDIYDKVLTNCNLIISQSRASSARSAVCLIKNLSGIEFSFFK